MDAEAVIAAAEKFGLTTEKVMVADGDEAIKIFKGMNQIFVGRAGDVAGFLVDYEKNLPGPYEGSIVGYKE